MDMDVPNWVLSGLVALAGGGIVFFVKRLITRIDLKFDQLIGEVKNLSVNMAEQKIETTNLSKRVDSQDNRLNDHAKRLRSMEINAKTKT